MMGRRSVLDRPDKRAPLRSGGLKRSSPASRSRDPSTRQLALLRETRFSIPGVSDNALPLCRAASHAG